MIKKQTLPAYCRLALGVAVLGLWAATAAAASTPETRCQDAKLQAVEHYQKCVLDVYRKATRSGVVVADGSLVTACDEDFTRRFQKAEAGGACRTPGGASTLREPLKGELDTLYTNLTTGLGCWAVIPGEGVVTCTLSKTTSAIDLADVVSALISSGVTEDTPFWIQAWGGNGSDGNVCCTYGGPGGPSGYAQMTTSLRAFESAYGTTELYYYLGLNGTVAANAGGDGGTATLVTVNDVATSGVVLADTLLIAGGGGGGGAGRGKKYVCGGLYRIHGAVGGAGASVFGVAPGFDYAIVEGLKGSTPSGVDNNGQGGQQLQGGAGNGGSSQPGGDPVAPLGGRGGNHYTPQIGFVNLSGTLVSDGGGQGSDGGNDAGGGGAAAASPAAAAGTVVFPALIASPARGVAVRASPERRRIRRAARRRPPRGRPTRMASKASSRSCSTWAPANN